MKIRSPRSEEPAELPRDLRAEREDSGGKRRPVRSGENRRDLKGARGEPTSSLRGVVAPATSRRWIRPCRAAPPPTTSGPRVLAIVPLKFESLVGYRGRRDGTPCGRRECASVRAGWAIVRARGGPADPGATRTSDLLIPTRFAAARGESLGQRGDGGEGRDRVFSRVISLQRGYPAAERCRRRAGTA